jgi:SPP1 family predicted phage head-tail adaptor
MSEFSGTLRERVTFQKAVDASDGQGGSRRVWQTMDSVWAHVAVSDVAERLVAGRTRDQQKYKITCRYPALLDPAWRVAWRGQVMAITAIVADPDTPERVTLIAVAEREQ